MDKLNRAALQPRWWQLSSWVHCRHGEGVENQTTSARQSPGGGGLPARAAEALTPSAELGFWGYKAWIRATLAGPRGRHRGRDVSGVQAAVTGASEMNECRGGGSITALHATAFSRIRRASRLPVARGACGGSKGQWCQPCYFA